MVGGRWPLVLRSHSYTEVVKSLGGKRVLLTGASSGLGPVIARRLAREGVRFILTARREADLHRLANELGGALVISADLSLPGEAERLAAEAGEVDILIANAGVPASGDLTGFEVDQIDRAIQVNLRSPIVLARQLLPSMVGRGNGHLVFMSSLAGKVPTASATIYNATKFGIRGFGLALRQELAGTGVGVSTILPTFVTGAGMFAETGLRAHPMAGAVTATAVAEAVHSAILRDRAEIEVAPLGTRAGLRVAAVAPRLAERVTRASGTGKFAGELSERQKHKR